MARHVWSVLCRRALVDQFDNAFSLLDMVDEVQFTPRPDLEPNKWSTIPINLTLASVVMRSNLDTPENTRLKVEVESPSGEKKQPDLPQLFEINLQNHVRTRAILRLEGVPFWCFGLQHYRVLLEGIDQKWEVVAEVPLLLKEIAASKPKKKPAKA